MKVQTSSADQARHIVPRVAEANSNFSWVYRGLLASLSVAFLLVSAPALAVTAPDLATAGTFGVLGSTVTANIAATTITGDLGYTTLSGSGSVIVSGATHVADGAYSQAGTDQGTAKTGAGGLDSQLPYCTSIGTAVDLSLIPINGGTPGVFPPGCYTSSGAMSIGSIIHLSGAGVYIFRPGANVSTAALNTAANSIVYMDNGACASDVFWAPTAATTLGANSAFSGTIIDDAGITLGNLANLTGRALAFATTVTADTNRITVPTCAPFVTPVPPANGVALSKVFFPAAINAGDVSRLTITLSSDNTGVTTLTAPLTDTLPGGMVIAPTPNAITTCGGSVSATPGGTTVSLPTGSTIPGGAPGTCSVMVNVTAPTAGSFLNTLAVNALQTNNNVPNNSTPASATLTVVALAHVPTLSEWALIMLAALLTIMTFSAMRRQSR